jgi:hypothetical protein
MRAASPWITLIPILAFGCGGAATRTHETCVKETIFATQRATEAIANTADYDTAMAAVDSLQSET